MHKFLPCFKATLNLFAQIIIPTMNYVTSRSSLVQIQTEVIYFATHFLRASLFCLKDTVHHINNVSIQTTIKHL